MSVFSVGEILYVRFKLAEIQSIDTIMIAADFSDIPHTPFCHQNVLYFGTR